MSITVEMDATFVIPSNRAELLDESSDNYFVENICPAGLLIDNLRCARSALQKEGAAFILKHFNTYYSVVHHQDKIAPDVAFKAYEDLMKGVKELQKFLTSTLEAKDDLNDELLHQINNTMKMMLYIFIQIIQQIQKKSQSNDLTKTKKKPTDFMLDKNSILLLLNNIVTLEINSFWNPPIVEENFVSMLADVCYMFLNEPEIKQEKQIRVELFGLFGVLIKMYNHGTTFTIRIVQLIKMYEHLIHCVPEGVQQLVEQFGCKGLVHDLLRELIEWQIDEKYQDAQGSRRCCAVITEMAVLMPELMRSEINYIEQYLLYDPPCLRIAILQVFAEVVLKTLTRHDLNSEERDERDNLLDSLLEHIKDVSILVRTKVIQQCSRFKKENAIPLKYQPEIMELLIILLKDRGALVRKAAANCITDFLSYNVYGVDLQLDKVTMELKKKHDMLESVNAHFETMKLAKIQEMDGKWMKILKPLKLLIENNLENNADDDDDDDSEGEEEGEDGEEEEDLPKQQIVAQIRSYLFDNKFKEAFKILRKSCNEWDDWKNLNDENNTEIDMYLLMFRSIFIDIDGFLNELKTTQMSTEDVTKIETLENAIDFLNAKRQFLEHIQNAINPMIELLESSTIGDMHEAIDFFIAAYKFEIDNSEVGVVEIFNLMKRPEQDRKEAVIQAFKMIYLETDCSTMNEHTMKILNRLFNLLKTITIDNINNLQCIIAECTIKGILDNSIIDCLWQIYVGRMSASNEDTRIAVDLLKFASIGRKTIISRNIGLVAKMAFSERGSNDLLYLAKSCELLSVAGRDKIDTTSKTGPERIPTNDQIFVDLSKILIDRFTDDIDYYNAAASESIDFIYKLCAQPECIIDRLMCEIVTIYSTKTQWPIYVAARMCHLLGILALKQMTYLDDVVYKELKRRSNLREERKKSKKKTSSSSSSTSTSKKQLSSIRRTSINSVDSGLNDDSALIGAQADDTDAEFVLDVLENAVVTGSGSLALCAPFIVNICEHPDVYNDEYLQGTAIIALIRFMLVSSKFCQKHIRLLFTIFEKTQHPSVKCTILFHLNDLLTRFPNIIDPWTPNIFQRLKDNDEAIRQATFYTLANLVLRDMIRVHSHISAMVVCMIDESVALQQMSKEFLMKLSHKESLYNVLPDVFSHLIVQNIDDNSLKTIMKFLFELIDKTKQMERLVDRFCLKFRVTDDVRQHTNIAYCLTLIQYNEKALTRLQENFEIYKHLMHNKEIYNMFKQIISNCSKQQVAKPNLKPIATELENSINAIFNVNENGEFKQPNRPKSKQKRMKKNNQDKGRDRSRRGSASKSFTDDD